MPFVTHPKVASLIAAVTARGGPEAAVQRIRANTWTVRWKTPRVEATAIVTIRANGKTDFRDGTLEIDGTPCPPVDGTKALAQILADPDTHLAASAKPLPSLPSPIPWGDVPRWLTQQVEQLADEIPRDAVTATRADGQWILALHVGNNELRLYYGHKNHADQLTNLSISVDGVDVTWRYEGDLEAAMAALTTPSTTGTNSAGAVTGPADATRSNAVETRRASVYRI